MCRDFTKTVNYLHVALLLFFTLGWVINAYAVLEPGFDQALLGDVGAGFGRNRAYGVAVADFNGDGIDDIVSGDTAGDVHYFPGTGDGTFTGGAVVINAGFHDAYGIATGDFDNDNLQDVVLSFTGGSGTALDGELHLYLGNGDGTFTGTTTIFGLPRLGTLIGDAGTDVMTLVAGDVDGDGDIDLLSGDRIAPDNNRADVLLFRNQLIQSGTLTFTAETIISAPPGLPIPEAPPYFPPTSYLHAYGLALGDVDNDTDLDLLVGDRANYLYVYENDGSGTFSPVRYETIGTRPFAFDRLHINFSSKMSLAADDMNGDGVLDFVSSVQTGDNEFPGETDLWLGIGTNSLGQPDFNFAGVIGSADKDARGLAVGQLNPGVDPYRDVVFGTFEGNLWGLFADLLDSDSDDIVDRFDNAPDHFNPPILDMNTDGGINRLDQLDNDHDGVGDPADNDDDNDAVLDVVDNCEFTPNAYQEDFDKDGRGDACDPLNNVDTDADGITDGPIDPFLAWKAMNAKATWAQSDTHFIIRLDALSRVFQNEFVQTMIDAATLTPEEWELKKFENYNGIGDEPAIANYQVPIDLDGGLNTPITVAVIPRLIFEAFGDPDPIDWINMRNANLNLEIALHGTYHANNTLLGNWATQLDRNFFSCETCGFTVDVMYQLLRVGKRTLLGQYVDDPWILAPLGAPYIDWSTAANPLISYAPPFNASDVDSRDAVSRLMAVGFSASVFEEASLIFTPEGSHQDDFDQFGMFHASADIEVDPEDVADLASIFVPGTLNTWLIEEVSWSTRYCNDLPRLVFCDAAPDDTNRENNMVDEVRWGQWLELLEFANTNGVVMTMGDYSLAMATDNCIGIPNPGQNDVDADGRGDECDIENIDVLPNSDRNPINLKNKGVVPIAILGSEFIDVTLVEVTTLSFGPNAVAPAHDLTDPVVYAEHLEDIDEDGYIDLMSHYISQQSGITSSDVEACLRGKIAGTYFEACDSITTLGR